MPRPIHFEIHAGDPARAEIFYRELFGWTFSRWGDQPYWVIKTGDPGERGIDGGLLPRRGVAPGPAAPVNAFVCTVGVTNLATTIDQGLALGGTIALPTMAIPGVGWLAYLHDTEGNILGLMEEDPKAK